MDLVWTRKKVAARNTSTARDAKNARAKRNNRVIIFLEY
jgi:hypothetical protein